MELLIEASLLSMSLVGFLNFFIWLFTTISVAALILFVLYYMSPWMNKLGWEITSYRNNEVDIYGYLLHSPNINRVVYITSFVMCDNMVLNKNNLCLMCMTVASNFGFKNYIYNHKYNAFQILILRLKALLPVSSDCVPVNQVYCILKNGYMKS